MALVVNTNNSELNPPIVLVRNPFFIVMACSTTLFFCLLAFASFNSAVASEKEFKIISTSVGDDFMRANDDDG